MPDAKDQSEVRPLTPTAESLFERAEFFEQVTSSAFDVEEKRLQTLLSLSGGAIVASLAIFQLLSSSPRSVDGRAFLGASWVLFGLTILAVLTAFSDFGALRSQRLVMLSSLVAAEKQAAGDVDLVDDAHRRFETRMKPTLHRHVVRVRVANLMFFGGVVALVVFGFLNLY